LANILLIGDNTMDVDDAIIVLFLQWQEQISLRYFKPVPHRSYEAIQKFSTRKKTLLMFWERISNW
jgi:hypothetical protein